MDLDNPSLVCDLVRWLSVAPRPYDDVIAAWRTSCPRLTVWEDAVDAGLVVVAFRGADRIVDITAEGRAFLSGHDV